MIQQTNVKVAELKLPSRIESIASAASKAVEIVNEAGFEEHSFGIEMAVREAVTNAIFHGNKRKETLQVDISFNLEPSLLTILVRDRGNGFDPSSLPDPTEAENLLRPSGRGILFMRSFMDEVTWSAHPEGGTQVRMIKKR
ncbi:MAG: ATP-binding protein [Pyrinomonadaceae bacterium]